MKITKFSLVCLFFLSIFFFVLSQPSIFCKDGLSFFAWFSYAPLFLLCDNIPIKKSFIYGALYGFSAYFLLCFWLISFGFIALFFVCLLFAFYNSVIFFLIIFSKKIFQKSCEKFYWIFRAFIILSVEFLRCHGVFGFSYGIIGYSQWKNPVFLYFSSFFGVMGVSFFILLFNSLFACIIYEKNLRSHFKKCLFFCVIFTSVFFLSKFDKIKESSKTINVALIQNASSASSHSLSDYENDIILLKKLTDEALFYNPETELIVWPETAVVPDIIKNLHNSGDEVRHKLSKNIVDYFADKDKAFLIGNNYSQENKTYNAAVFFNPDSEEVGVYCKSHLVPFTEYWPEFLDFDFLNGLKNFLNCEFFSKGNKISIFQLKNIKFSVPICFEDSFPTLVNKMKKNGAEFFVNISDDAWSHSEACQNMHLSMSVFRCAESAVPMIRSTIDGKTCIIDSNGLIVSKLESGKNAFLSGQISVPKNRTTFYSVFGEVPLWIFIFFAFIFMLILSVRFCKMNLYVR